MTLAGLELLTASRIGIAADCFDQLAPSQGGPGPRNIMMIHNVKLDGVAKGGELVLLEMINPIPRYIRINTQAGESSEAVIARMAAAINEVSPFNPDRARMRIPNERGEMVSGDKVPIVRADGNLLKSFAGVLGNYIFAGTETGLGIPPPPMSLTATYDPETQEVSLHWETPVEDYDGILIHDGDYHPGNRTSVTRKLPPPVKHPYPTRANDRDGLRADRGLRLFRVNGCRACVISNAAAITLNYQDHSQEELDTQPFTAGVAPNWTPWSSGGEPAMLVLEQGTKGEWKQFDQNSRAPLEPDEKPFYQLIKTRSPKVTGGVYRKFLGLQPGHTYRMWTRMNTLDMDKAEDAWSFSLHADAHAKSVTLTSEQMTGRAPLTDGNSGSVAGQVAAYAPGSTTGGKFVERSTEKLEPDSHVLDITLPPGAEVITVWFRCSGSISTGVGFDWIKLKDITAE